MHAIVAYDGSAGAEQAATLALGLPWPAGSKVTVIAALEPSTTLVPVAPSVPARMVVSPEVDAQLTAYLEDAVAGVVHRFQDAGVDAEGRVVHAHPATAVIDAAAEHAADLVITGSRGHGALASLVLGSVSAELVDHAPCPVLVARGAPGTRVLFATDGSAPAAAAERVLAEWPIFANATIRVLSAAEVVRPWHTGVAPTMVHQVLAAYEQDLEHAKAEHEAIARSAAERLAQAGRTTERRVRIGDPAAEIVEEATAWPADLIVVGSRGRTGLTRVVLGSVARNVLSGGHSSVLIVRAPATEKAPEGA